MTAFLVCAGIGVLAIAIAYQYQTGYVSYSGSSGVAGHEARPALPTRIHVKGVGVGVFLGLWGFVLSVVGLGALLGLNVLALFVR